MKRLSLKLKVGIYCACLTALALIVAALLILPMMREQQIEALDQDLATDSEKLVDELKLRLGPTYDWQKPMKYRDIPLVFQRRYLCINGANGEELYISRNTLRKEDIRHLPEGSHTIQLFEKNCRIGVFKREVTVQPKGIPGPGPTTPKTVTVTIWMGTRLGVIEDMQEKLKGTFWQVLPFIVIGVFLGGLVLASQALKPVTAMTAAAERISAQSPDERLPNYHAADEIARLTTVLNESFDRLQRAYSSAARFSADASHQLKTPIAVLRAGLDELRMCDYLEAQDRETVHILIQQTRRLTTLVEDLLLLAQADAGRLKLEPQPLNMASLLAVVLDDTEALGAEKELIITLDCPENLHARADARRVKIILQNLTENAVKYNIQGGKIRINARKEGEWTLVTVANTGSAIPEQYQDRLFERFNRAGMGENIKGHGLGLNIARELARAHGGDLTLTKSDGIWTEFALRLPCSESPVLAMTPAAETIAAA